VTVELEICAELGRLKEQGCDERSEVRKGLGWGEIIIGVVGEGGCFVWKYELVRFLEPIILPFVISSLRSLSNLTCLKRR